MADISSISPAMAAALAMARRGRLTRFRVGWAHDKSGPFFAGKTVAALVRRGVLLVSKRGRTAAVPRVYKPRTPVRLAVAAAMALAAASSAQAHEVWADGSVVPDWVKSACCGAADAHVLQYDEYWIDRQGFHIKALDRIVPLDTVLPSQDGRVWAFWNGSLGRDAPIYCVFYSGGV